MTTRNFVIGLGIVIIYGLVLAAGFAAFYPGPQYEDYCGRSEFASRPFPSGVECAPNSALDEQARQCYDAGGDFRYEYDANGCPVSGTCDTCSKAYDDARDVYSRNIFIISVIIGILTFVVGFAILSVEPVGSALLASGMWAVVFGTIYNWRNFGNITRFFLLLIVLVILIFVAYRLNTHGRMFTGKKKK